jgi:transposase
MNAVTFKAHVEQHLAPTLAPGDIVVCDTPRSHQSPGVRAAERRFLPPCSPGLTPIEQVFARPKTPVRTAAPTDVETLWTTIGRGRDAFTPHRMRQLPANSGDPQMR